MNRPSGPARFCIRCGTERLEGARFCIRCGAPFDDTPATVATAAPPALAAPVDAVEPPWASSGRPHPLRFSVPRAPRRRRRTLIAPTAILIGQFLLLHFGGKPGLIVFAVFWTAVVAITFLLALAGWLVRIAVGRLPRLLGAAAFGWLGTWARLWSWFGLLVDWSSPPAVELDPAAGRGLGLIARPLTALPALVVETLWLLPGRLPCLRRLDRDPRPRPPAGWDGRRDGARAALPGAAARLRALPDRRLPLVPAGSCNNGVRPRCYRGGTGRNRHATVASRTVNACLAPHASRARTSSTT